MIDSYGNLSLKHHTQWKHKKLHLKRFWPLYRDCDLNPIHRYSNPFFVVRSVLHFSARHFLRFLGGQWYKKIKAAYLWAIFLKWKYKVTYSNVSATRQMITTRKILPQFIMIWHNRHQKRHIVMKHSLSQEWRCESKLPYCESNPRPCAPQARFGAPLGERIFWPRNSSIFSG